MNVREIKVRIVRLGKKNTDVIRELNKRDIYCTPTRFSSILSGNYPIITEKIQEILVGADKILTEWEAEERK